MTDLTPTLSRWPMAARLVVKRASGARTCRAWSSRPSADADIVKAGVNASCAMSSADRSGVPLVDRPVNVPKTSRARAEISEDVGRNSGSPPEDHARHAEGLRSSITVNTLAAAARRQSVVG